LNKNRNIIIDQGMLEWLNIINLKSIKKINFNYTFRNKLYEDIPNQLIILLANIIGGEECGML